jgi:hypothetical protein
MQENVQQSKFMIIMKKIWPYINRVLNAVVYFIIQIIRNFFKSAIEMIKGT